MGSQTFFDALFDLCEQFDFVGESFVVHTSIGCAWDKLRK